MQLFTVCMLYIRLFLGAEAVSKRLHGLSCVSNVWVRNSEENYSAQRRVGTSPRRVIRNDLSSSMKWDTVCLPDSDAAQRFDVPICSLSHDENRIRVITEDTLLNDRVIST